MKQLFRNILTIEDFFIMSIDEMIKMEHYLNRTSINSLPGSAHRESRLVPYDEKHKYGFVLEGFKRVDENGKDLGNKVIPTSTISGNYRIPVDKLNNMVSKSLGKIANKEMISWYDLPENRKGASDVPKELQTRTLAKHFIIRLGKVGFQFGSNFYSPVLNFPSVGSSQVGDTLWLVARKEPAVNRETGEKIKDKFELRAVTIKFLPWDATDEELTEEQFRYANRQIEEENDRATSKYMFAKPKRLVRKEDFSPLLRILRDLRDKDEVSQFYRVFKADQTISETPFSSSRERSILPNVPITKDRGDYSAYFKPSKGEEFWHKKSGALGWTPYSFLEFPELGKGDKERVGSKGGKMLKVKCLKPGCTNQYLDILPGDELKIRLTERGRKKEGEPKTKEQRNVKVLRTDSMDPTVKEKIEIEVLPRTEKPRKESPEAEEFKPKHIEPINIIEEPAKEPEVLPETETKTESGVKKSKKPKFTGQESMDDTYFKTQELINTMGYRNEFELKGRSRKAYDIAKDRGILDMLEYSEE